MKIEPSILAAAAALAFAGAANAATTIAWGYQTISSNAVTSWVTPAGAISIKAMNMGSGGSTLYGGVTWLTTNPPASQNNDAPITMSFHAPGQAWAIRDASYYDAEAGNGILWEGNWGNVQAGGVDYRVDLGGFTVDQEYLVQFVVADTRNIAGVPGRTITIDGYSTNIASQDSSAYTYAYTDGKFAVVTARFTPTAGDTAFAFRPLVNGTEGVQLNALHILTIPEPSATALAGLAGVGLLLRRRRA